MGPITSRSSGSVRSILLSVADMDVHGLDAVATVGQLEHNTEYIFVVKHMNEAGTSKAGPPSNATRTDAGPPGPTGAPTTVVVNSSSVALPKCIALDWAPPADLEAHVYCI